MQQWSKVPPGAITFVGFSHQCRACYRQALAIWCRLLALQRRDNAPVLNMTCSLCIAMHGVSVSGRTTRTAAPSANLRSGFSTTLRGQALAGDAMTDCWLACICSAASTDVVNPFAAPSQRIVASRAAFQVVAKQNSLKRQRTSEKARVYNKAHKSAVATRMKKVCTCLSPMQCLFKAKLHTQVLVLR